MKTCFQAIILAAAFVLLSGTALAQMQDSASVVADTVQSDTAETIPRTTWNNAYLELGGNAGLGSVNYERMLSEFFCIRIGVLPNPDFFLFGSPPIAYVPLGLSWLFGRNEQKFELGATVTLPQGSLLGSVNIGYRYQPKGSGLLFRIAFTPMIVDFGPRADSNIIPWGGISFGWNF
jgi:hypothetical protein